MADLTSKLTIAGSVNGRKISFTHTYTMSDVYDVGDRISGQANNDTGYLSGSGPVMDWAQDTPNYLFIGNKNTQYWSVVGLGNSGNMVYMCLAPGQCAVLHAVTAMANITAVANSTALLDVVDIDLGSSYQGQGHGTPVVYAAFNAVS